MSPPSLVTPAPDPEPTRSFLYSAVLMSDLLELISFTISSNGLFLLGSLGLIAACLATRRRRIVDKDGNSIPNGPTGLPIVGLHAPPLYRHSRLTIYLQAPSHS